MAASKEKKLEKLSYEEALDHLERIVEELESEDISLEDLVKRYDRGMKLLGHCEGRINQAKQRIETLSADAEDQPEEPETKTNNQESEDHEIRLF